MQSNIVDLTTGTVLFKKEYQTNFTSEKGVEESGAHLLWATGELKLVEHWLEGMHIMNTDLLRAEPSNIAIQTDASVYTLLCCLQGSIRGKVSGQRESSFSLNAQQATLLTAPTYAVEMGFLEPTKIICIQLTETTYGRLIVKRQDRTGLRGSISDLVPAMRTVLKSLMSCPYPGVVKRIFLEAKALELIALLLSQQCPTIPKQLVNLPKSDHERIMEARKLIEQNIRHPFSIIDLAHKVGLNDFKLKKGFKQVLGTTVFGYLSDIRMEKAWKLLADEKQKVSDVAYEVGYKNAHHFSAAFKKKYGLLPSQLNK